MLEKLSYPSEPEATTPEPSQNGITPAQTGPDLLQAALGYASKDTPVFPCVPGGKNPLTEHGFKDATTDKDQIQEWWERNPNANIGIPAGNSSGLLVLDLDNSEAIAEAERRGLPATMTVRTARGMHLYFKAPSSSAEAPVKSRDLFPGAELKAEGTYVIAPLSMHPSGARYRVEREHPLAAPPKWLLEAPRGAPRCSESKPIRRSSLAELAKLPKTKDEGPIVEGTRNLTLTKYGGKLRAWGYGEPEIFSVLRKINHNRCTPPLPEAEVSTIARSVSRYPAGTAKGAKRRATPETMEALRSISETLLNHREWRGMGGKTERDVVAVLVRLCKHYGEFIPAGVRVSVSYRDLAVMAASSVRTITRVITRLKKRGILRADNANRQKEDAGALVLLTQPAQGVHTPSHGGAQRAGWLVGVDTLRAPRLRWSAAGVTRLGKTCGAIIDHLDAAGGTLSIVELASLMGQKRARDLKRRNGPIERLTGAEIASLSDGGDALTLARDWLEKLERERDITGEISKEHRDRARHERQRAAYRLHMALRDIQRRFRALFGRLMLSLLIARSEASQVGSSAGDNADGFIEDLEPLVEVEFVERRPVAAEEEDGIIFECAATPLTTGEREDMEAICAYIAARGPGSFRWDQASCKALFYSPEGRGSWPTPEELEHIRLYWEANNRERKTSEKKELAV